jgi:hypothetical protein
MKWRKKHTPPKVKGSTQTGGAAAHKRAEVSLAAQQAQQPEVTRVAESLRQLRERNHFAAQIRLIFQGGPQA